MTAQLRLEVGWDDIAGRKVLYQTVDFDGTPDGFDAAIDEIRVAMHEEARSPLRPCGHPGPWHEVEGVVEPTEGTRASTQAPSAKESAGATAALRPWCSPLYVAGDLTRLPSSADRFAVVTTCLAYPPGSCLNERAASSDLCAEHLEVRP